MATHIARAKMDEEQHADILELNAMNMCIARTEMDEAQLLDQITLQRNAMPEPGQMLPVWRVML